MFDWLATSLFAAAAAMFMFRMRFERPAVAPYALVGFAAVIGWWAGEDGLYALGVGLIITGAFLLLHLASLPYSEESEDPGP
ncbi:MAG: hypothetical protein GC153_06070 [Alphaproteobacteria bacterium]|nr:hypothetical protein [Alphaproteobacteria bacterium]